MTQTPQTRWAQTPGGMLEYTLTRKRVKNINLRLGPGGAVSVSAPNRVPLQEIDKFVAQKAGWIEKNSRRLQAKAPAGPCGHSKAECLALFTPVSERVFPLFAGVLGGRPPVLRVRDMKSRWGSCNIPKRTITLNMRLADKPMAVIEYVVLHEYVHFLYPNHQSGFHREMARLMPDYKERRKLLRES